MGIPLGEELLTFNGRFRVNNCLMPAFTFLINLVNSTTNHIYFWVALEILYLLLKSVIFRNIIRIHTGYVFISLPKTNVKQIVQHARQTPILFKTNYGYLRLIIN